MKGFEHLRFTCFMSIRTVLLYHVTVRVSASQNCGDLRVAARTVCAVNPAIDSGREAGGGWVTATYPGETHRCTAGAGRGETGTSILRPWGRFPHPGMVCAPPRLVSSTLKVGSVSSVHWPYGRSR